MKNFFSIDNIFVDLSFDNMEEIFKFLAEKSVEQGVAADKDVVFKGILDRENQFSTNLGDKIAIPHSKNKSVLTPTINFIKLQKPVIWSDGEEISVVINILVPEENDGNIHLKIISSLARKLINEEFKNNLLNSNDADEINTLIKEALGI